MIYGFWVGGMGIRGGYIIHNEIMAMDASCQQQNRLKI